MTGKTTKETRWTVYILQCADGTLYTGITTDIDRRLAEHESGKGAKYTQGRGPLTVMYREDCGNRSEASSREAEIKTLNRADKLALCT